MCSYIFCDSDPWKYKAKLLLVPNVYLDKICIGLYYGREPLKLMGICCIIPLVCISTA